MSDFDNNFNLLQKLYKIIQPKDLVGRYRVEKYSNERPDPDVVGQILKIFVDTCDPAGSGLLRYNEIKDRVEALGDDAEFIKTGINSLDKYVKLHDNVDEVLGSLSNTAATTKLHVISLNTPMLGISLRDTNRVGVFLNAVPSIELARCVPRLEVNFGLSFPGEHAEANDQGFAAALHARSPTLLHYINGSADKYGSADAAMARGSVSKVDLASRTNDATTKKNWEKSSYVTSGMELFTTPQTLTSPDDTLRSRQTPVLDRFSALMSIESLEITTTPAGGAFSNKTARLNLVLHDRSRLHEIAALIKPDAYSRSTVSLTYGWSHPDMSGNNPIADLINQMVVHDEKYNIINSSFSFGNGGGVRLVLQLSMKGQSELNIVRIADNAEFHRLDTELHNLSEVIREARNQIPGLSKSEFFKEDVRVYQIIDSAANNAELIENYKGTEDKKLLRKLVEQLQRGAKDKNNTSLYDQLGKVLENMNKFLDNANEKNDYLSADNKQKNKTPRVDDLLGDKFKIMIGHQPDGSHASAQDPYLDKDALFWKKGMTTKDQVELKAEIEGTSKSPRTFVSLAKLLLFYVGIPLQTVGTFDEVQFVYYPINTEAGYAGGTNLAGFPVEIQYFREVLADHSKRKGSANLTVREFLQLLNSTILQDVRHPAYGMREVYNTRNPTKPHEPPSLQKGQSTESTQNALAKATGGVFRKPDVTMQVECRGGRPLIEGETQTSKGDLRIVRIHIYDKLSSAYEPTLKVMQAQQNLEALGNGEKAAFAKLRDVAEQIGLKLDEQRFNSYDDLKRFISQVVPVLNYGANSSGILAATLQTQQNSDLATVNMQRAMGPQSNSEPLGSSVGAIPLRVQPSQLDLTLIGCPLLNPAQQFFVDFSTGTTVDDLYTLTHLSHIISAGKFESTAKLTPMNAYGTYESVASKVKKLKAQLDDLTQKSNAFKSTWGR